MATKYIVAEIQTFETGQVTVINTAHDTREDAEAKFYTLCAAGCKTALPLYTVMLFTGEGFVIETKKFIHEKQPEPEPETTEAAAE